MACRLARFYDALKDSDCRQMDGGVDGYSWKYGEGSPEGWLDICLSEYSEKLAEFRYQTRYRKRAVKPEFTFLIGRRLPFLGEVRSFGGFSEAKK